MRRSERVEEYKVKELRSARVRHKTLEGAAEFRRHRVAGFSSQEVKG